MQRWTRLELGASLAQERTQKHTAMRTSASSGEARSAVRKAREWCAKVHKRSSSSCSHSSATSEPGR